MQKFVILAATALATSVPAAAASPLEGVWTSPKGNVTVRIAPCGRQLCGEVIEASAKAKRRAAKQGVTNLVGEPLLKGIEPTGPNRWKGRVFVPNLRTHVGGRLTMLSRDRIEVAGCFAGLLCRSAVYRRVS